MKSSPAPRGATRWSDGLQLPFGYYVERVPELLLVRRPDGTFVAAFIARDADPFEVEVTVWEDAD